MAQAGVSKTAATKPAAAVQLLGANQSKRKNTEGTQGYTILHKIMNGGGASIPAGRGFGGKSLVCKTKPNRGVGQGPPVFLSKSYLHGNSHCNP